MKNWMEKAFGTVEFLAQGGLYERLITACAEAGVPLHGLRAAAGGFTAWVPLRYYRQLYPMARRYHVRLRAQKKAGLCFWLRRYRGRWGLVLGPAVFLLVAALLQNLVWSIRFVGLNEEQQAAVGRVLYSMGISEGTAVTQQLLEAAGQAVMSGQDGLGWVSLNFIKGRLVVEGAPAIPAPAIEPNDPVDLVAAADATLLWLKVQEGYAVRQAGQTVAEGEVLVSAVKEDRDQNPIQSHARAAVWARLEKSYECAQPLEYTATFATGRLGECCRLRAAGRQLTLWDTTGGLAGQTRVTHAPLTVFGFALPVTVENTLLAECQPQTVRLSSRAAREFARYACQSALYAEFPDAELLTVSEQERWENGCLVLRQTVLFEADIARPEGG